MQFISKIVKIQITIPDTDIAATDYIYLFSNNGSGEVSFDTPLSPKLRGMKYGTDYIFTHYHTITSPALWKYKYRAYDTYGNQGTIAGQASSVEISQDLTTLVPQKSTQPKYTSYIGGVLRMNL